MRKKSSSTPKEQPNSEESQKNESRLEPALNFLEFVQTLFSVVLGFSTLLLLSGFVIVNLYLRRLTDVHGYNVSTGQYIAAGIGFWGFILIGIIAGLFIVALLIRRSGILNQLTIFKTIVKIVFRPWKSRALLEQLMSGNLLPYRDYVIEGYLSVRAWITAVVILAALVGVFVYGLWAYGTLDRALGGGKPATIVLSIKSEYPLSSLGLSSNATNPTNTTTIWLLAELTDGLLVADQATGRVVAVKNDAIVAVIDDTIAESLIVPSATPTTTPTATFTPVPTETATP